MLFTLVLYIYQIFSKASLLFLDTLNVLGSSISASTIIGIKGSIDLNISNGILSYLINFISNNA